MGHKKRNEKKEIYDEGFSKNNFLRHFLFYFAVLGGLIVIAYLISILPNIISNNNHQDLQFQNFSEMNRELFGNCENSITSDSKYYNVIYDILIDDTIVGSISYRIYRTDDGYKREIIQFLDTSALISELNQSQNDLLSNYSVNYLYYYDKNFNCINSFYSITINNQSLNESYVCLPPDIPFRICKEDLSLIKENISIQIGNKSFTSSEYILRLSSEYGKMNYNLTLSDLPFPITMKNENFGLRLKSYFKIE
ncbi:MAG: hypothetical protein NZ903_00980 [Candidatus Micrarchaeota archaeon]|nr:hypothetical protein [Candidatus Micrarchaeota archaeon]